MNSIRPLSFEARKVENSGEFCRWRVIGIMTDGSETVWDYDIRTERGAKSRRTYWTNVLKAKLASGEWK